MLIEGFWTVMADEHNLAVFRGARRMGSAIRSFMLQTVAYASTAVPGTTLYRRLRLLRSKVEGGDLRSVSAI